MNGTKREQRDMHRARMTERRARQRGAGPSFTPFTNKRIQTAFQQLQMTAMMQGLDPMAAQSAAMQALSERLAVAPTHRRYGRLAIRGARRSRSDDPAYRKSIWPEGKVAGPGRVD
jgi:hypothetical protein